MFFNTNDFDVKIISLLELNWEKTNKSSGVRPFHALSFRLNGDAVFYHHTTKTIVKSGDIVFVPAHYPYTLTSGKEHLFVIHFITDTPLPNTITSFSPQNFPYFARKFEELYLAWHKKELSYEYECKSIFYKLITNIERNYAQKHLTSHNDDRISEIIDYIHENYTSENLSVEKLAAMSNISCTYLRKLFHKHFNVSPQKYINNLKVKYAIELLQSGYYSVCEVSDICNFQNVHYFSAFIKKETGVSPSKIKHINNENTNTPFIG